VLWPPLFRVAVAERSMEPAVRPGDWLLVRRTRRIRVGQVVVARHPGRPDMLIVKRAARRVGGGWWLESDNPGAGAVDSRRFGPVPEALVEGRVLVRYRRRRTHLFPAERAVVRAPGTRKPGGPGAERDHRAQGDQCRGMSGASAIRALCSATSRCTSSRGSATATAQ
jgi:nickel-type superoxide dismutase maturation protease